MRSVALPLALGLSCWASSACEPKKPVTAPVAVVAVSTGPSPTARLADAHALLRIGCLDCLLEAYQSFDALRAVPAVADLATAGAIQSAALVALRERSLGMSDSGHLQRARALVAERDDLQVAFGVALSAIDVTAPRIGRVVGEQSDAEGERRSRILQQNRTRWLAVLGTTADDDPFWAVLWVSFSCGNSPTATGRTRDALLAPLAVQKDAPSVLWEVSTCAVLDADVLQQLVERAPRFHEADYWLTFSELRRSRLDEAQALLTRAYEWHRNWPSAALTLAGLFMTSEDLGPALEFYDRALTLLPGLADGMVGRVRALSYMGRFADAIAGAGELLQSMPGEAHFWRAWNENQLDDIEPAWTDIEEARRTLRNSEVAKLGGVIAYRRHELEVARSRLEDARRLNPDDCDAHYYLGAVQAELRAWAPSVEAYLAACTCLDAATTAFTEEIARIEASNAVPARKARLIASRRAKIASADRETKQSWFNLGVDYFNLGQFGEARRHAEKVLDDEQFGERARAILAELKP